MSMEYSVGYILGACVGVLITALFILVFLKFTKKDGNIKCRFDERQNIIRGKGYKYAFFTLLIYNALILVIGNVLEMYMDREMIMFIGICLSVIVYAAYAIWNEGYFSLNENPKRVMIIFGVVGVINLISGISSIVSGEIIENGKVSFRAMNLLCAVLMFSVLIVLAIKTICNREEDER
ncbi:MAG: hypothetical protein J6A92_01425 [Lachnospiraceae bacterium]|nr:hypothetical protein [Lachnospiraceae bacterium]